ncbi:Uncharacterised protein [Mycobacteroides abscessus]|nr:Uncharacterised protein [Mycobacteroides abscessus]
MPPAPSVCAGVCSAFAGADAFAAVFFFGASAVSFVAFSAMVTRPPQR